MVKVDVVNLFQEREFLKICAPMVRYSKLPFRILARKYGCDLCFTPMIMADSFVQSAKARKNEFTTTADDSPLIVQFASNSVDDFVSATELVALLSDGVDLNCGCPQRWAMKEGYGACLLSQPQKIKEMVLQARNRISEPYSVSVKIRLLDDIKKTVNLAQSLEAAGASFLTLHARTVQERHSPIHEDDLRTVNQSLHIPLIANGDVKTLKGAQMLQSVSGCKGVMAARGMLSNPALFSGAEKTPLSCVEDWINISLDLKSPFQCFHHHLVFMLEHSLSKEKRRVFNLLKTTSGVLDFLEENFNIQYTEGASGLGFNSDIVICDEGSDREKSSQGKYFTSKMDQSNEAEDELFSCIGGLYDDY